MRPLPCVQAIWGCAGRRTSGRLGRQRRLRSAVDHEGTGDGAETTMPQWDAQLNGLQGRRGQFSLIVADEPWVDTLTTEFFKIAFVGGGRDPPKKGELLHGRELVTLAVGPKSHPRWDNRHSSSHLL